MFVFHFVDPNMRVEIFFQKDEAPEKVGVDFEIENLSNSTHLYWRLKKIACRACLIFYLFLVIK